MLADKGRTQQRKMTSHPPSRGARLRIVLRGCRRNPDRPHPHLLTFAFPPCSQRAFRERKERHVKDLEAKLASLEAAQHETASENEKLKRDLQKMSTENEILKATSSINGGHSPGHGGAPVTTGPLQYNPTDFYTNVLSQHPNKTPSHRIVTSDSGERLYAAGATWDYIISHELYKRGLVDIADISNRLKHLAKCDGQGPVFEEKAILEAIEESVASGSDELL